MGVPHLARCERRSTTGSTKDNRREEGLETAHSHLTECSSRSRDFFFFALLVMSTAVVRTVLCFFLTDQDFWGSMECFKESREEVRVFMQTIAKDDAHLNQFDNFASNLMKMLEKCFFSCVTKHACRSKYMQREKVWAAFHQLRLPEAAKLWQNLFIHGFSRLSRIVYQQVNQKLYSDIINCHLSTKLDNNSNAVPALTNDEENILRYAAG